LRVIPILLVALVALLLGCAHWEPYPLPASTPEAPRLPTSLRVWTADRAATVLARPMVRADTVYGSSRGDTLAIPLSAVQRLERQRLEAGRTAAAVAGGLALWITLGVLGGGLE
jgi:hypothetical protein